MGSLDQRVFGILGLFYLDLLYSAASLGVLCRFHIIDARGREAVLDLGQFVVRENDRAVTPNQLFCEAPFALIPLALVLLDVRLLPA